MRAWDKQSDCLLLQILVLRVHDLPACDAVRLRSVIARDESLDIAGQRLRVWLDVGIELHRLELCEVWLLEHDANLRVMLSDGRIL